MSTQKKILLIDDDPSLRLTLEDFLSFEGYDVTTADCGEQGLQRLEEMTPDLIILDMSMPGMGGIGFLKEISTIDGTTKHAVLVLTARANMAEFFADMSVDGFVAKPCDPNDLLMEVGRIIFLRSGDNPVQEDPGQAAAIKILLGEDDPLVCDNLAAAFTDGGHIVDTVARGPEVLEKAIVGQPDIIVLKLVFVGMNGDAVARMLNQMPNTRSIPIVLYDDSGQEVPESKFTEAGIGIVSFVRDNSPALLASAVDNAMT